MKPTNVKSRILKRLIPVLLVPVVLSSNFAAIYVSADEETVIETEISNTPTIEEPSEEAQEPVIEEPVVEEPIEVVTSDEAGTEGGNQEGSEVTVPAEGASSETLVTEGGEASSQEASKEASKEASGEASSVASSEASTEDESGEASTVASTEASGEETEEPELEEVKEPRYVSVSLTGNEVAAKSVKVNFAGETGKGSIGFDKEANVFAGYEGDKKIELSFEFSVKGKGAEITSVSFDGQVSEDTTKMVVILSEADLDKTHTLRVEAAKVDSQGPVVTDASISGTVIYVDGDNKDYVMATSEAEATVTVEAADCNDTEDGVNATGVASAKIMVNGKWQDMIGDPVEGEATASFTWAPAEGKYGIYEINRVAVYDNKGNFDSDTHISEILPTQYICYYDPTATVELEKSSTVSSGEWINKDNVKKFAITIKGSSVKPVCRVTATPSAIEGAEEYQDVLQEKEVNCKYNSKTHKFDISAIYTVREGANGAAKYTFTAVDFDGNEACFEDYDNEHVVKVDVAEYALVAGDVATAVEAQDPRTGKSGAMLVFPAHTDLLNANHESKLVSGSITYLIKGHLWDQGSAASAGASVPPVIDEETDEESEDSEGSEGSEDGSGEAAELPSGMGESSIGGAIVKAIGQIFDPSKFEQEVTEYFTIDLEGANPVYDAEAQTFTFYFQLEEYKSRIKMYETYEFKNFTITDEAGNTGEVTLNSSTDAKDAGAPSIVFNPEKGKENLIGYADENGKKMYFTKDTLEGTIDFYDINFKEAQFSDLPDSENTNHEDYIRERLERVPTIIVPFMKDSFKFVMDGKDGEDRMVYHLHVKAIDTLDHTRDADCPMIVVDKKDPAVTVKYDNSESTTPSKYYNNNGVKEPPRTFKVTFTVKEAWFDEGRSKVSIVGTDEDGNQATYSSDDAAVSSGWSETNENDETSVTITVPVDGTYHAHYEVYDKAGRSHTGDETEFVLDRKPVQVEVKFDGPNASNKKYYNGTRTATITVTDYTFNTSEDASKVTVLHEYGNVEPSSWVPAGKNKYERKIIFEKDGIYHLKLALNDLAENVETTWDDEGEFVIDKTAPKIVVNYDNNNYKNEYYYKDARMATVYIEDLSFDADLVKVTQITTEDAGVMPSLGGFTSSGLLENRAQMLFDDDGSYAFAVDCKDLAGNVCETYKADMFVIDRTIPEVKFSGVENFSANNGTVAPVVSYIDKNMDLEISHVTMTGSNNGVVNLANKVDRAENGFVVSYSDFEHVKGMDDLYILQAHVMDLAGNENKDQLVFSVNRFGSVFVLSEGAKALNEQYYTKDPIDVAITEINVDDITEKSVSISRDGDIKELKSGKHYTVSKQGSDTTWKTYTYTVSKDNFGKDGIYSVTVYTKDRATNTQDNKSRDAEINFAVDKTAPSIVTAGLKNGEVYKEASHVVNIDVTDNMGVTNLTVFKDGKEIESYDEEQLLSDNGVETVTLSESDKKQSLKLVAEDVAGNIETVEFNDILVSTKETEILPLVENNDSESIVDTENGVLGKKRETGVIGFIVLALGVVAAGTGAGVTLYKKKQNATSED